MKYILILQICSVVYQQCSDPYPDFKPFNNYFDCATAGYFNAITINQELGMHEVISGKIMVNFKCEKISDS
tara:strand:+ start:1044 stop:1256 length:213 start_codon:yes stop_codon:yes gene_type:complete